MSVMNRHKEIDEHMSRYTTYNAQGKASSAWKYLRLSEWGQMPWM
jgi:hypothetical protein